MLFAIAFAIWGNSSHWRKFSDSEISLFTSSHEEVIKMAQVIKFNFKIIIKFKKINPKIWIKPQIRNIETNYQINMISNQINYKFNMINPYLY